MVVSDSEVGDLILTDDEIAAIAVGWGVPWPTALPTVADDVGDLLAAARRGRRALVVRELWDATEQSPTGSLRANAAPRLQSALAAGLRWGIAVTDADLVAAGAGPCFYHFGDPSSDVWITDVVRSDGVHDLSETPRRDCTELLKALIADALSTGVGPDSPDWLCVVAGPQTGRALLVRPGEVRRHLIGAPTGESPTGTRIEDAPSVADALAWFGVSVSQSTGT